MDKESALPSGLLPTSLPLENARNLRCWSAKQREQASASILVLCVAWRADWGLDFDSLAPRGHTRLSQTQAKQALAMHMFGPARGSSADDLGADSSHEIAQTIVEDAWQDWRRRMQALLGHPPLTSTAPEQTTPWDGSLIITIPWWDAELVLCLDADSVANVLSTQPDATPNKPAPATTPLTPIGDAIANQLVEVRTMFSPVSLTLGEIQSLRAGDIVPLTQRLDQPAKLVLNVGANDQGVQICQAWLGQRQGLMAAELARSSS